MLTSAALWTTFGFLAQFIFTSRMVVQWWTSEKAKKSVVPVTFWLLSLLGSAMLLIYAIHNRDWPIALGQATGVLVYVRNLQLIRHTRRLEERLKAAENVFAGTPASMPPRIDESADRELASAHSEKVDS